MNLLDFCSKKCILISVKRGIWKMELKKLKKAIYIAAFLINFGLSSYAIKEVNDLKNEQENEMAFEDEENVEVEKITFEDEENVEVKEKNNEPKTTLSITREEAEELFIRGEVDKMSKSYPLDEVSNSGVTVRNIYKDGKKYLVDANDICKVYLADYESYGGAYYDKYKDLYYYAVLKNNMDYYIDAKDFSIILGDMEAYSNIYYLSNYDFKNGGLDNDSEYSGYVMEVVYDGIRYLVDAEDSTKIIAYGFEAVTEENDKIIFTYSDGNTQVLSKKNLLITETDFLTKTISY